MLKLTPRLRILGLLLIFAVFFILRLYHLGYHDLWFDEIDTVGCTEGPWGNWRAPLYEILLHFWIKILGFSEFNLRFPSLIFNFLSVILVFFLGKGLFSKKVGIIASIFMGLSAFQLWYAQEARSYSMVLFLGTFSSFIFFKAIKREEFKLWLFFALVSLAGIYTNYFYIFLFLAQGLYLVFFRRLKLSFKEIVCFLSIALGFSFYLPRFLRKFYFLQQGFWIPRPDLKSLIITLENFILGYNGFPSLYLLLDILMGLLFIWALVLVYKKKELRQSFIYCLFLLFTPILLAFSFSKIFFSIYLDRGLIIFSPYFYLILSLGIASLNRELKAAFFVILIPMLLIADYGYFKDWMFMPFAHHTGAYIKKPVRPIARFLKDNVKSEDMIGFTNQSLLPSLSFYAQKGLFFLSHPPYYFFDPKIHSSVWQTPVQESKYGVPFYKINHLKFRRLWVISSDWARSGQLDENSQVVKNWLDKNLKPELVKEFDGLWIFRYVRNEP